MTVIAFQSETNDWLDNLYTKNLKCGECQNEITLKSTTLVDRPPLTIIVYYFNDVQKLHKFDINNWKFVVDGYEYEYYLIGCVSHSMGGNHYECYLFNEDYTGFLELESYDHKIYYNIGTGSTHLHSISYLAYAFKKRTKLKKPYFPLQSLVPFFAGLHFDTTTFDDGLIKLCQEKLKDIEKQLNLKNVVENIQKFFVHVICPAEWGLNDDKLAEFNMDKDIYNFLKNVFRQYEYQDMYAVRSGDGKIIDLTT